MKPGYKTSASDPELDFFVGAEAASRVKSHVYDIRDKSHVYQRRLILRSHFIYLIYFILSLLIVLSKLKKQETFKIDLF